jgi:hypothetical protein
MTFVAIRRHRHLDLIVVSLFGPAASLLSISAAIGRHGAIPNAILVPGSNPQNLDTFFFS